MRCKNGVSKGYVQYLASVLKVAEAFDAYSERVEEPNSIEPALNRALQQIEMGRAALLDVILEPTDPRSP